MRSAVLGVMLLGVVAACGEPVESSKEPSTASSTPSGSPTSAAAAQNPARALSSAIRALTEDSTGSYSSVVIYGVDRQSISEDGVYDIRNRSSRSLMNIVSAQGNDDLAIEYIKKRNHVWFRYEKTGFVEGSTCWHHMRGKSVKGLNGLGPAQTTLGLPPAVHVALEGRGRAWNQPGESVRGTTDLYTLASTVGKMTTTLGLDVSSTDRAAVDYELEDSRLVGWKSSVPELLSAIERSGVQLPGELTRLEKENHLLMRAQFSGVGEPVSIERPDPRKVLEFDPGRMTEEEYESELRACEAR